MSVIAVLLALLLEQISPMRRHASIPMLLRAWVDWIAEVADAGTRWHALYVLVVAVVLPALAVCALEWLLRVYMGTYALLVLLPLHVAVLYVVLGFRQFSQPFRAVQQALVAGDLPKARAAMRQWRVSDCAQDAQGLIESSHRYALADAHHHVFGVLFMYAAGAFAGLGLLGAVLYKLMAVAFQQYQPQRSGALVEPEYSGADTLLHVTSPALQRAAGAAWRTLDFFPSRCSAMGFALLGDFESAVAQWRKAVTLVESQALPAPDDHVRLVQMAGAGALGVELHGLFDAPLNDARYVKDSETATETNGVSSVAAEQTAQKRKNNVSFPEKIWAESHRPAYAAGGAWYWDEEAYGQTDPEPVADTRGTQWSVAHLDSLVALLWRAVIFWILLLAVLQLALWLL